MITENLSTLKIHKLTQEQYNRELANGNIDEHALYLTPDEEIDLGLYATVEQLNDKADVNHKHIIDDIADLQTTLDNFNISKVDKIEGMGLSTNDFTDEYKTKLNSVVLFTEQELTETQKILARTNIGAQSERVYVTISSAADGTLIADKTFSELTQSYENGAELYCFVDAIYLDTEIQLRCPLDIVTDEYLSFTCVSNEYTFVNIIHSDNTVTVKNVAMAKASDVPTISEIIDLVYPVGAIYLTVNKTSPAMLFGGTWEQIKDRFLLATGDTYAAGSTGGEAKHSLTIAEMPKHNHIIALEDPDGGTLGTTCTAIHREAYDVHDNGWGDTSMVWNTGGSQAHNNMPPYLAVYMYKRVE